MKERKKIMGCKIIEIVKFYQLLNNFGNKTKMLRIYLLKANE